MANVDRFALFSKLDGLCFKALHSAHELCKLRRNPLVELAHWFNQILILQSSDLHSIIREFGIDSAKLSKELQAALDHLPRGTTSTVDFSSHIEDAIEQGYLSAGLLYNSPVIRSSHLLVGILKDRQLKSQLSSMSPSLAKLPLEKLTDRLPEICAGSPEQQQVPESSSLQKGTEPEEAPGLRSGADGEALSQFTVDLTADAAAGRIDPVVGRDHEIHQVIDILIRRRQNNPILVGEAGVGKTAIVEGLALRFAAEDVPPAFKNVRLLTLDLAALAAGASLRGEFEKRLKQVITEVKASLRPIILFVDEAHTLMGAGGSEGTGDAANLLKPALARGNLRVIAATTWSEYKKHIEKDAALTRRFQLVKVDQPDDRNAIAMMRAVSRTLERHHKVTILDDALAASVTLSRRYIPDRQLPDKSVSLLDTACARVSLSQSSSPARIEDGKHRVAALELERDIASREEQMGFNSAGRSDAIDLQLKEAKIELKGLDERWSRERALSTEILEIRDKLASHGKDATNEDGKLEPAASDERRSMLERIAALQTELASLQGEDPLVHPCVDQAAVAQIVAEWTGIPVGRMVRDEMQALLALSDQLKARVIGQDHALETIAKRVRTNRAGLGDPNKPIGVFLLCGPSGVGKTETALALAELLYGGEQNLITLNMSEFQEAHTVSTLKGAPPGYVGYGEGGRLTEAVRRRPYAVILLDEIEKAHKDVHEVFFQVFDKGAMEDGEGRLVDFKNSLIILTSNVGDETIISLAVRPGSASPETITAAVRPHLLHVFPAALLGRLTVIPYYPLADAVLADIIKKRLARIALRAKETYGAQFVYSSEVVDLLRQQCRERESGGRVIDAVLTNTVLPRLSQEFLARSMSDGKVSKATIGVANGDISYQFE